MKTRNGFVSNSSSSSFLIHNKTGQTLTLLEFVNENISLVDEFNQRFENHLSRREIRADAKKNYKYVLNPGANTIIFGDDQGSALGRVYYYMLRGSGSSKRFGWSLGETCH